MTTWLTVSELAQLRNDILETLPDTCRIERRTIGGTVGYATETWGTATASVGCRFDPFTDRQDNGTVAERDAGVAYYQVTLPFDAAIEDGDRLVKGGKNYQVVQLHDLHSDRFVRRALVALTHGE